ncbi:MAG: ATPase, T2SS/T4P/T4SS family [Streptosporangiaceae bacterium]
MECRPGPSRPGRERRVPAASPGRPRGPTRRPPPPRAHGTPAQHGNPPADLPEGRHALLASVAHGYPRPASGAPPAPRTASRCPRPGTRAAPASDAAAASVLGNNQNAGKTTLLRALASEIPAGERIATLESEYELYLHESARHPDVIAFESRAANSEGAGSISLHDLIAHALRHNPHRIVVGEVRQSEIMPMLEAMNSGQQGSMCTLHANSPAETFDRILILALRGGLTLAERAIHLLVGMAVDLIVHVRKRYDGHRVIRYVAEICEVLPPGDTERPAVNRVFLPARPGGLAAWAHTPSADLLARLEAAGFRPGTPDDRPTRPSRAARTGVR